MNEMPKLTKKQAVIANKVEDCLLFLRLQRVIRDSEVSAIRERLRLKFVWNPIERRLKKEMKTQGTIAVTAALAILLLANGVSAQTNAPITNALIRLNGQVAPHGCDTTFFFQYGTGTNYSRNSATGVVPASVSSSNVSATITNPSIDKVPTP